MNIARLTIPPHRTHTPHRRWRIHFVSSVLTLALIIAGVCFGAPAQAAGGPFLVKDISTATGPVFGASIRDLTPIGNVAFFSAENPSNGRELWKSDGTTTGTATTGTTTTGTGDAEVHAARGAAREDC